MKQAQRMDCVILCETYEHGVSVLWRASAALLRWQRLAIRYLSLCAQRAAAARALRAREERSRFPRFAFRTQLDVPWPHPPTVFVRRVRQRCRELAAGSLR